MIRILQRIADEVDFMTAIGPLEYVKDKMSDIGWAIEYAFGEDEDEVDDNDNNGDVAINEAVSEVNDEDLIEEANKFIGDHISEIKEVIIKTVKGVSPSGYTDQQAYLEDVFGLAADACWEYIQDIFSDPGISPELSNKITETMIKDTAVIVATTMFVEWALRQKADRNDDSKIYKEEEEVSDENCS